MRVHLRLGRRGLTAAVTVAVGLAAPLRASADIITINDGATPDRARLPFTCAMSDAPLWLPTMGFVYRNVEPFDLSPGDTIAFDLQGPMGGTLGFRPQVDLALAHAPDPLNPFKPADLPGSDFTVVANDAIAASPGNQAVEDYELAFTVDTRFSFPGGGLIIRVSEPKEPLFSRTLCLDSIAADRQPSGTNRLVGVFRLDDDGEHPWPEENTTNSPLVPYVRIIFTRCGDGRVSGNEKCDDGNTVDDDDCSNTCIEAACGDGRHQVTEACDNSSDPANPDPFCNDVCNLTVFAKGSGCSTGGGAGLAAGIFFLAFVFAVRRRRARARAAHAAAAVLIVAAWAVPARAQPMQTDGFRVDRFEMAPSVEDAIMLRDPSVLRHMIWSVNVALGFTNTILRVVPTLDSDVGVDVVGPRLSAYLDFAIGFKERFELNVSLPFALAQSTESGVAAGIMLQEASAAAVGDARLGGSVLLYGRRTGGVQAGFSGTLALPLGSENSFTGDGGVGGELVATAGYAAPRYRLLLNAGIRFRPEADYITSDQGTELIGRAGVVVPFMKNRLATSLEFDVLARTSGDDAYREMGSPILALLGARYHFAGGIRAGAGIGMGLTEAPGSPAVRTLVTVGYSPEPKKIAKRPPTPPASLDSDGDGITDNLDRCPKTPEDVDGIQDDDGCPDPDSDGDKITDVPTPDKPMTLEQVITLPLPIEFYFDTAVMRPGAEVYLNQVLAVLQKHPEVLKLELQGHTSAEGGHDYNMRLSNDRAKAVVQWLVDHGVDAKRLEPRGYGLTQPLAPNNSEANRQKNRRVQFRLLEAAPGLPPIKSQQPPTVSPNAPATPAPAAQPKPATPAPAAQPKPATPAPAAQPPAAKAPAPVPATQPPAAKPATPATPPVAKPAAPAPAPAAAPKP